MNDGNRFHADDGGELVPRDTAERVLRLAIEMEARRGEILTRDELFRIARDVGVHPEYVRRALDAERAADVQQERERAARAAHPPTSTLVRVIAGIVGVLMLLMLIVGVIAIIQGTGEALANGFSLEDAFELLQAVFIFGLWGGLTWLALSIARHHW